VIFLVINGVAAAKAKPLIVATRAAEVRSCSCGTPSDLRNQGVAGLMKLIHMYTKIKAKKSGIVALTSAILRRDFLFSLLIGGGIFSQKMTGVKAANMSEEVKKVRRYPIIEAKNPPIPGLMTLPSVRAASW